MMKPKRKIRFFIYNTGGFLCHKCGWYHHTLTHDCSVILWNAPIKENTKILGKPIVKENVDVGYEYYRRYPLEIDEFTLPHREITIPKSTSRFSSD